MNTRDASSVATTEWEALVEPLRPIGAPLASRLVQPDDAQLRHELYQSLYSQIASGYIGLMHADPQYPDFWPGFNLAFNIFANPDTVYYMTPIDDDGVYKISGFRGNVRMVDFQISAGSLFPRGAGSYGATLANYAIDSLQLNANGSFEVILSAARPGGYEGNWWKLPATGTSIMVRQVAYDWNEEDARLAIERLDRPAAKPRPTAEQIAANLRQVAEWTKNFNAVSLEWVKRVRDAGANNFEVKDFSDSSGLSTQRYAQSFFDLTKDEALIIELAAPEPCRYWGIQMTDELWRSIDWVNRHSSLNGHSAQRDPDGKYRIVISAVDPGVPNWLDNAGYRRGIVYGRWVECGKAEAPVATKVNVADVRKFLPSDTPVVTPTARDADIRMRRKAAQLRRRW